MRALLLLAHGSRRQSSNDEIRALAARVRERAAGGLQLIAPAFLELEEPSIGAAIDQAVAAGADDILLFPLFLTAGRHVAEDIPAIVREAQARHPAVTLELKPHLGAASGLTDLVLNEL